MLYLTSKPAFFGNLPRPAFGSDLSPPTGVLPARYRFENGQVPNCLEVGIFSDGFETDDIFVWSNWPGRLSPRRDASICLVFVVSSR